VKQILAKVAKKEIEKSLALYFFQKTNAKLTYISITNIIDCSLIPLHGGHNQKWADQQWKQ
jgi:hypothetical protein